MDNDSFIPVSDLQLLKNELLTQKDHLLDAQEKLRLEINSVDLQLGLLEQVFGRFVKSASAITSKPASSNDSKPARPAASGSLVKPIYNSGSKKNEVEERIRFVLAEYLKGPARYQEIEEAYKKHKLPIYGLRSQINQLKKKEFLAAIQYNNLTQNVFWGLNEWVAESEYGPTFKKEVLGRVESDTSRFPNGILKSEFTGTTKPIEENQKGHTESEA